MTDADRIVAFLKEHRTVDGDTLRKVVCVQIVKGARIGDELRTYKAPEELDDEWIDTTAAKIVDAAKSDATEIGAGPQRYAVQAWLGSDDRSRARFVFTVAGKSEEKGITLEGPDGEGVTSQMMRHNEALAQLLSRNLAADRSSLFEENARLRADNDKLRIEQFAVIDKIRKMALADVELAGAQRRDQLKTRAIEGSIEKLETWIPHAFNAWSKAKGGGIIFPEAAAQILTAKAFVDQITDADLKALEKVLPPEKVALLVSFATSISKMPEKKDEPAAPREIGETLAGQLERIALNGVLPS